MSSRSKVKGRHYASGSAKRKAKDEKEKKNEAVPSKTQKMTTDTIYAHIPKTKIAHYIIHSGNTWSENVEKCTYIEKHATSNHKKMFKEIAEKNFGEHTGVVFEIEYTRKAAHQKELKLLFDAIRKNMSLETTTKLLILHLSWTNEFDETRVQDLSCATRVEEPPNKRWRQQAISVVKEEHKNFDISLFKDIKNLVVLKHWSTQTRLNEIDISSFKDKPLQEAVKSYKTRYEREEYFAIQTTAEVDVSLFQLNNSQLAIIINTNTFSKDKTNRDGSMVDVKNLSIMCANRRIPHLVIPNLQQMLVMNEIITILRSEDFSHIEIIHIFLMSHGEKGNKIYTGDGKIYSLSNVLDAISSNKKINFVNLYVVACRGKKDMPLASQSDLDKIECIRNDDSLNTKTIVWRSTKDGYTSIRHRRDGTPFIQTYIKVIKRLYKERCAIEMTDFAERVQQELNPKYEENEDELIVTDLLKHPDNKTILQNVILAHDNYNDKNQILLNRLSAMSKDSRFDVRFVVLHGEYFQHDD